MSVFLELSAQHALIDGVLGAEEQQALDNEDEGAFDRASLGRQRNDQAYFLYLFTRFEACVNDAVDQLLSVRASPATLWAERRIWEAWSKGRIRDIAFLSKVEVLTEKSRADYLTAHQYFG